MYPNQAAIWNMNKCSDRVRFSPQKTWRRGLTDQGWEGVRDNVFDKYRGKEGVRDNVFDKFWLQNQNTSWPTPTTYWQVK